MGMNEPIMCTIMEVSGTLSKSIRVSHHKHHKKCKELDDLGKWMVVFICQVCNNVEFQATKGS